MESDDEEFNMTLEDELAGLDTDFTHIFAFDSESVSNSDSQRRARPGPDSIDIVYAHFLLTCQAAMMNSGYLNKLDTNSYVINANLWAKINDQKVPFHRWYPWIVGQMKSFAEHR